ncbi:N-6 DNA methylase [Chlorobium sp. KB01]|uniref:Eco57I restriction-modification methylase domain-containing protein n=1 Tax=Chlorobium sp. KB01 TaxID=1917528 RepID=UPI000975D16C|nr:N-6 DNA methylase [Chlorobium sp. KB01]
MIGIHEGFEAARIKLQSELDARKTQAERNRLGQFATPTALAFDILAYALILVPEEKKIRFLDPAVGTGSFFSAFREVFAENQITGAVGFEIDPHYGEPASRIWRESDFTIKLTDFTTEEPNGQFNLVICNPPYVRHHHLQNDDKVRLQARTSQASGMKLSGLAGLYCHFIGLSHPWMAEGCVAGWLIPSEFMDVNYGKAIKHYLLKKVTLLKIHRFDPDDVQFTDALVSSAVVWFKNEPPPDEHTVTFTYGGTLLEPRYSREVSKNELAHEAKWSRFPQSDIRQKRSKAVISDFFYIRRGIATGDNDFFILCLNEIKSRNLPLVAFRPILPSPRYLTENEVQADANGLPLLDRQLFLLDTRLSEERILESYPELYAYLQEGKERGIHERYLCGHRSPWYSQENRLPAPFVCTYLGRSNTKSGRPFRFILNNSSATVANVYLAMYPKPLLAKAIEQDATLLRKIWEMLNRITPEQLMGEGRVYGGGLRKLEPGELANVDAAEIAALIPDFKSIVSGQQLALFGGMTL